MIHQYYSPHQQQQSHTGSQYVRMLVLLVVVVVVTIPETTVFTKVAAVRNLQVAFPLQSLTIWDSDVLQQQEQQQQQQPSMSFRGKFVSKFQKGLQAEVNARNVLQQEQSDIANGAKNNDDNFARINQSRKIKNDNSGNNRMPRWAIKAAQIDQNKHRIREALVEQAYDSAMQQHQKEEDERAAVYSPTKSFWRRNTKRNPNRYQFVGVINSSNTNDKRQTPITWYTRPKPNNAKWTIRLVHVNRAAILKDLYNRKKIDVFVQYHNENLNAVSSTTGSSNQGNKVDAAASSVASSSSSLQPIVTGQYHVRERSWKNLWNMSIKHMFTDSSGMYWRERRITSTKNQQLYTDGQTVYESTYRYIPDGRNGMHRVSTLQEFLNSRSIDNKIKRTIVQRLQNDVPDIVLEE